MTMRKVAVSIPEELVEDARRAVAAGSARSVSAYVTEALRSYRHRETLGELLAELNETDPLPADARRWAHEQLDRVAGVAESSRAAG